MTEQWQELKETITELRDNDGTGTQQEVCKFLANYMDILEKQAEREPATDYKAFAEWVAGEIFSEVWEFNKDAFAEIACRKLAELGIVKADGENWVLKQEPKMGHWIADIDRWGDVITTVNGYRCDKCNAFDSDKDNYCPNCGAKMIEPQEGAIRNEVV